MAAVIGRARRPLAPLPAFDDRVRAGLDEWIEGIAADIQTHGESKRLLARGASVGVNVLGTAVMLGTFLHTGGLTGVEVGSRRGRRSSTRSCSRHCSARRRWSNSIEHARQRLQDVLAAAFAAERERFEELLPASGELTNLATELRSASREIQALPAVST